MSKPKVYHEGKLIAVYAVQINSFQLTVQAVCPACGEVILLVESDDERKCRNASCPGHEAGLVFKMDVSVAVFTGVKP